MLSLPRTIVIEALKYLVRQEYGEEEEDHDKATLQPLNEREEDEVCVVKDEQTSEEYQRLEKDVNRLMTSGSKEKPASNKALQRVSRASSFDSTGNPGSPFQVRNLIEYL